MFQIKIEVSARHCHLSRAHLAKLFGHDHELTPIKQLSQIGQFASEETVTVKTPDGQLEKVRVLGPTRTETQVELSMTDTRKLKLHPPIRLSGEIEGSESCTLVGPAGEVHLHQGVIIAKRHVHCDPESAKKIGLHQNQIISVQTPGERSLIFHEVEVRISKSFTLAMHLDTDEGNSCLPDGICSLGDIIALK